MKELQELYELVRSNLNSPYFKMLNALRRGIETNNIYFNPFIFALSHGRGACTTSAALLCILYGIELDWYLKKKSKPNWDDPKYVEKRIREEKPYHTAPKQKRAITGHAVVLSNNKLFLMEQITWAIEKLGLRNKYTDSIKNSVFMHKDSGAKIFVMSTERFNNYKGQFKYIFIDDASELSGPEELGSIQTNGIRMLNSYLNTFIMVSYLPYSLSDWTYQALSRRKNDVCFKKIHATYRTVPKDWLGEGFFEEARMLHKLDHDGYMVEYMGKPMTFFSKESRNG